MTGMKHPSLLRLCFHSFCYSFRELLMCNCLLTCGLTDIGTVYIVRTVFYNCIYDQNTGMEHLNCLLKAGCCCCLSSIYRWSRSNGVWGGRGHGHGPLCYANLLSPSYIHTRVDITSPQAWGCSLWYGYVEIVHHEKRQHEMEVDIHPHLGHE